MHYEKEKTIDYKLKSSDSAKDSLFEKLSDQGAFTEISAVSVEKLKLTDEEDIAFDESVLEEEIIVFQKREKEYCYLIEYYKPMESHKTEIRWVSLPIIILCLILMGFLIAVIVSQIYSWF